MFHVIQTGGKQYIVKNGDSVVVEKIDGEEGSKVVLPVLMSFDEKGEISVGTPVLEKVTVEGTITLQDRADKLRVFKMKRRKRYRKSQGHRQYQTTLQISKAS